MLPGGSLKVNAATARSVSMSESFDTPLVVGYLGFDCQVLEGGLLGPPIPTHAVLEEKRFGKVVPSTTAGESVTRQLSLKLYGVLEEIADNGTGSAKQRASEIKADLDALAAAVPAAPTSYVEDRANGYASLDLAAMGMVETNAADRGYRDFLAYRDAVKKTERILASVDSSSFDDAALAAYQDAIDKTSAAVESMKSGGLREREALASSSAMRFLLESDS